MRYVHTTVLAALATSTAIAQDCPQIDTSPGNPGVAASNVGDFQVYDDGTGPALYAAGGFTTPGSRVAKWDGNAWSALGSGASDNFATSLGAFDGRLYLGGFFTSVGGVAGTRNLAAWNGTEWQATGANLGQLDAVWSFGNFDDGNGEALYIGGSFVSIAGMPANRIARYDGKTFEPLGSGLTLGAATIVLDMVVYDDGTGPALFVCGRFDNAGGVLTPLVAKWNGTEWESVGGGLDGTQAVNLTVYNGDLYVSGSTITPFATGETTSVAKWNGSEWESLGEPIGNLVWELFPFDDGTGEALYAVGAFDDDVPSDIFKKWTGTEWVDAPYELNDSIFDAEAFDDGNGPGTFLGGSFTQIDGQTCHRIVKLIGCDGACPADCNADGNLNILDFICFQNAFAEQQDSADCDDNGQYNILDFICYQNVFAQGCN